MTPDITSSIAQTAPRVLELTAARLAARDFVAPRFLRHRHSMTIFAALYPRRFQLPTPERREFETEPGVRVVAYCHWQADKLSRPTIILIHGLEGSADGRYILGTAAKAWAAGANVVRMNVRNCGGTAHLAPGLYHSGLTADLRGVTFELIERDRLPAVWWVGFSMGANHALKLAGELGDDAPPELKGVCAVSPPIDLALCARDIIRPENRVYDQRFLRSLKATLRHKNQFFPGLVDFEKLGRARTLWEFDEVVTAPHFGFRDALDYYTQSSSLPYLARVRVPTLMIHAHDDPFIPFEPFKHPSIAANPHVLLHGTRHGGHVGFYSARGDEDRFWAESRAVEFCLLGAGHSLGAQRPLAALSPRQPAVL
jgi:uncharacterized protein